MCKSDCEGFFIRKQTWLDLISMDPDIEEFIKHNVMHEYNKNVKFKVLKMKEMHLKRLCERSDLKHMITLVEKEKLIKEKSQVNGIL